MIKLSLDEIRNGAEDGESDAKGNASMCVRYELRRAPIARFVAPSAGQFVIVQYDEILAESGADAGARSV